MVKLTKMEQMHKLAMRAAYDARGQTAEMEEAVARELEKMDRAKQDKITGIRGQVVGFNSEGKPEAQSVNDLRGPAGADGKSAYQYAVDGGYTGTEEEFQVLLNDIPNKQPKLTGTAGQVVGFGADGAAAAVQGWSNLNLLDNAYWANRESIINQLGQEEYTATGYTIDRWYSRSAVTATLQDNGLRIRSDRNPQAFNQRLENFEQLLGQTVTVSMLITENRSTTNIEHFGLVYADNVGLNSNTFLSKTIPVGFIGLVTTTGVVPATPSHSGMNFSLFFNNGTKNIDITVAAVKLELGSLQTLAHQDASGNWVLNDPPPNKALELAKCQRYLVPLNKWQKFTIVEVYGSGIDFVVPVPTAMRANPAIVGLENLSDVSGTISFNDFEFRVVSSGPALCCRLQKSNHGLTLDQIKAIQVKELSFLDANL